MKTKHLLVAVLLLSSVTAGIFSCRKQTEAGQSIASPKIEQLAVKYTSPIGSDAAELKKTYSNLNLDELKQFWIEINKINRHKVNLTEYEIKDITAWVEISNSLSLAKTGKPFNKISGKEKYELFYETSISKNKNTSIDGFKPPPPPEPTECILYSYPLNFYRISPVTTYSPAADFYTEVEHLLPGNDPCSAIEYSYSSTLWGGMHALTLLGEEALVNQYGEYYPWHVRKAGGYTKVYAPKSFLYQFGSSFADFNNHIRLTVPSAE